MAYCECCGAPLKDGDQFCGECGTIVAKRPDSFDRTAMQDDERTVAAVSQPVVRDSAPADPYGEQTAAAQPAWNRDPAPAQPASAQPAWAQYVNQPQQPTFVVPQRPLGKGSGVTMIVFGAIMIGIFLLCVLSVLASVGRGDSDSSALIGVLFGLGVTLFAGGLLLLLFGIRKVKNVARYNKSIGY